jgi:hypothetical protein
LAREPSRIGPSGRRWLIGVGSILVVVLALAVRPDADRSSGQESRAPALVVGLDSLAGRQVVALGRDLRIEGSVLADAVALDGSAVVAGSVGGDLIVVGGDATLSAGAKVEGDVFVFGGRLETAANARIGGRTVVYPDAPATWALLLEGPSLGLAALSPTVLGAKVALLLAWLVTGLGLVAAFPRPLESTAAEVAVAPLRGFAIGLVAVVSVALWLLFLSAFAPPTAGLPLAVVVIVAALVLKLWGTIAVLLSFGAVLTRRLSSRWRDPVSALVLGLVVLGAIKLVPWIGVVAWTAMTLIGVGSTLTAKLGRREP